VGDILDRSPALETRDAGLIRIAGAAQRCEKALSARRLPRRR
jgi:hypothetical protein